MQVVKALFTQKYGSGKVAFVEGETVVLHQGANGTTYIFQYPGTQKVLYTYNPEVEVEIT